VMDRSIDLERTVVFAMQNTTTVYGLHRCAAELRIGQDGVVAHNQAHNFARL
jgi:hypothetical protein